MPSTLILNGWRRWCAAGALWFAAISTHAIGRLPDEEALSALLGRSRADSKPPFDLPDWLPGGGVKMFHRAATRTVYEYSQGGRIHVYQYTDADAAAQDFAAFAKGAEKFDEKASAVLAQHGACITRQSDTITLWVVIDDSVAGFETPKEKWSLPETIKTVETVVATEAARLAKQFGNPERALTTFLKAVQKMDESQIFRALTAGGDPAAQANVNRLRKMMPMMHLMMMDRFGEMLGGGERPRAWRAPKVGKPQKTADGVVFVPVEAKSLDEESPWLILLVIAAGQEKLMRGAEMMANRPDGEPLWIPMTQVGNRWAVDVARLGRTMFGKLAGGKPQEDCFGNLRQLLLALKAFANDNEGRFPDKLSALVEDEYVVVQVFVAPNSQTNIKDAAEVDAKSDFIYEGPGKVDDGDGDFILLYDKPGSHEGKGRHVGFADGHVQWIEEAQFKKMLETQRAARPKTLPLQRGVAPPNRGVAPMPMPPPVPVEPIQPPPDDPQGVPGGPPTQVQPLPAPRRR